MKKLLIPLLFLLSCNTAKQLERTTAKVEKYKKILGVKPCECNCPQTINWGVRPVPIPYDWDRMPITIDTGLIFYNDTTGILKHIKFDTAATSSPGVLAAPFIGNYSGSDSGKIIYLGGTTSLIGTYYGPVDYKTMGHPQ